MKRVLCGLMVFGIFAAVIALMVALRPTASIDWQSFEPRFRNAIRGAGFAIMEERMSSEVALPINLRLRAVARTPRVAVLGGFPDTAFRYTVNRYDAARIDCYARYLDGRAVVIEIRSPRLEQSAAVSLQTALTQEFPELPIRLKTQ